MKHTYIKQANFAVNQCLLHAILLKFKQNRLTFHVRNFLFRMGNKMFHYGNKA